MKNTDAKAGAERGTGVSGGALGERRWLLDAERRTAPGVVRSSGDDYGTISLGIKSEIVHNPGAVRLSVA